MVDRMTALAGRKARINDRAGIGIAELCPATLVQVDVWPDRVAETGAGLAALLDKTAAMPDTRRAVLGDGQMLARLTPERFLLISEDDQTAPMAEEDGSVFDLSHARCCLRISGDGVEHVLAKGAVLDFSVTGFPVGTIAQTMAHHMDLTIIRRSETEFDVLAFRGFAESLLDHLMDAADEFGVSFRPFSPPT